MGEKGLFKKARASRKKTELPESPPEPKEPEAEAPNLESVEDLDAAVVEQLRIDTERDIKRTVEDAIKFAHQHSRVARQAGHRGLATDLVAFGRMAAQISKKLETQRYWEKV